MEPQRLDYLFGQYLERSCTPAEFVELLNYFRTSDTTNLDELIRAELKFDLADAAETAEQTLMLDRVGRNINAYIDAEEDMATPRIGVRLYRYAAIAAIALLFIGAYLFRVQLLNTVDPIHQLEIVTQKGERKQLQLADGTSIWLAPDSKINYPEKFRGDTREITVSGEAFFEVKHDAEHPFIVHAGQLKTQVLGTSFDVRAYAADPVAEVVLLTGKIAVSSGKQQAIISPNQRVLFADNRLTAEEYPEAQRLLDRRAGNLAYKRVPLPDVIHDLERNYNLNIVLDKRMLVCKFSGQFKAGEKAESILMQLTAVFNASYKKTATNHYTVTGKSCN